MNSSQDIVIEDLNYICKNLQAEFDEIAGKKLLITGGAGFLGYYLVQSVLYWNEQVEPDRQIRLTIYDNYIRGMPDWLVQLKNTKNLRLVKHNIIDPLPADIDNFQYIIHAAGIASPIYYRAHPIETMDANINGLRSLLDYCLHQKGKGTPVEGFLFYSSSEIYGDPDPANIPTPETYRGFVSCTGPRACYDESKRYGETLCVNFAQQYGLPIKSARPFNNYGPGLKITDRRVIPDYARDVLAGRDIVMLSDGAPTRTFCYVADAVVGYYKVLVRGRAGEAYNIGVETPEISMLQLAERVVSLAVELFGYRGKVVKTQDLPKDYLVDNPNRRCPVVTKARTELGYQPSITLDEGLRRSLIWYNENQVAEDA
ncbi:MAG TPA: NAD-dependent epimerase/dehydratase family protein [Anaerolineae bacterium]|nr:NAD-dependent epimerase/dehydratase family protein [Anaerolineae bacterium]